MCSRFKLKTRFYLDPAEGRTATKRPNPWNIIDTRLVHDCYIPYYNFPRDTRNDISDPISVPFSKLGLTTGQVLLYTHIALQDSTPFKELGASIARGFALIVTTVVTIVYLRRKKAMRLDVLSLVFYGLDILHNLQNYVIIPSFFFAMSKYSTGV